MSKSIIAVLVVAGFFSAIWWQQQPGDELAALQGEWRLVGSERDGQNLAEEHLYDERLVIAGTRFSRSQTAPNGSKIKGESGSLSTAVHDSQPTLEFSMMQGTAHAIYRMEGDELVICVTREGGPRPDSFDTELGDSRILYTYQRVEAGDHPEVEPHAVPDSLLESRAASLEWQEHWRKTVLAEVPTSANRDEVVQWLTDHGFQGIENKPITLAVMKVIHPDSIQDSIEKDGVQNYVYGRLHAEDPEIHGAAIEVYFLFGDQDKRLVLSFGPLLMNSVHDQVQQPQANRPSESIEDRESQIENADETTRLTETWKVRMPNVDGHVKELEVGQILSLREGFTDEVQLTLNPNHEPGAIDVRYVKGPEQRKVLKGISEWIPSGGSANADAISMRPALRIGLFTRPHPDQPYERPVGFKGGMGMGAAIWERLSFDRVTPDGMPLP